MNSCVFHGMVFAGNDDYGCWHIVVLFEKLYCNNLETCNSVMPVGEQ